MLPLRKSTHRLYINACCASCDVQSFVDINRQVVEGTVHKSFVAAHIHRQHSQHGDRTVLCGNFVAVSPVCICRRCQCSERGPYSCPFEGTREAELARDWSNLKCSQATTGQQHTAQELHGLAGTHARDSRYPWPQQVV